MDYGNTNKAFVLKKEMKNRKYYLLLYKTQRERDIDQVALRVASFFFPFPVLESATLSNYFMLVEKKIQGVNNCPKKTQKITAPSQLVIWIYRKSPTRGSNPQP